MKKYRSRITDRSQPDGVAYAGIYPIRQSAGSSNIDSNSSGSITSTDEYSAKSILLCPEIHPNELRIQSHTSFPLPFAGTGTAVNYGYNSNLGYLQDADINLQQENTHIRSLAIQKPSKVYRLMDASHFQCLPHHQTTGYDRIAFGTRHPSEGVNVLYVEGNVGTRSPDDVPLVQMPVDANNPIRQDDPWLARHKSHR